MTKKDEEKESQLHPDFMARLRRHPELHERIDAILRIVDGADGDAIKADEAEERVAREIRQIKPGISVLRPCGAVVGRNFRGYTAPPGITWRRSCLDRITWSNYS